MKQQVGENFLIRELYNKIVYKELENENLKMYSKI